MRLHLWFPGLAVIALASLAAAQCPVQELESALPDFAHFGRATSLSGPTLLVGSVDTDTVVVYEESGGVWQETARLDNPTPSGGSLYGVTVALSGDTAAVAQILGTDGGRVHVFVRSGSSWTYQAALRPSGGAESDLFGASLAVDGDTLVARKSVGFDWTVHVFERTGTTWEETQQLTQPGISFFGSALALEGDTLLIGDNGDYTFGFNIGAGYIYDRVGGVWTQSVQFFPSVQFDNALFGTSVDLESGTAVIGAPAYLNEDRHGSAYVFEKNGSTWAQTQRLRGLGAPTTSPVGLGVSIQGDRILLGARGDEPSDTPGSAYVFEKTAGEWLQTSELRRPAGDDGFDRFGYSVAQRGDQIFVGSPGEGAGVETGVVHVFDATLGQGTPYCLSTVNSTGLAAEIASAGSHIVAVDDVTLVARNVPNEPGLFVMGQQATQVPLYDGFLCVAQPLQRLPLETAAQNRLVHHLDLSALPVAVVAGSTWNFQAWFRDPDAGGTGANLSDGVTVSFCP